MAIDPATIVWDDEPQAQPQRAQAIDPSTVIWDDAPITDLPTVNAAPPDFSDVTATVSTTAQRAPNPANDSAFARMISGQPAPQPEGSALGRFLGQIGGREVLQGAYGLYGSLGGDAVDYAVLGPIDRKLGTNLGTGGRGYRQAASDLADSMGMYKPQTAQDRIVSGVGEALTGTGLTLGIGGGLNALANLGRGANVAPVAPSRLAELLTTQPVLQGVSAATGSAASGAVRESGGSQGQQLAAGLLGGLGPGVASAAGGAALRGAVRGTSGQQMRNTLADFNALGANPSVGQASGNRMIQGAENLLAGGPTSSGVMSRFVERQSDDISAGLRRQAEGLTLNPSGERAGRAVERGIQTFDNNVGAMRRALYWEADRHIPPTAGTPMTNTLQELRTLTAPNPGAAETTARIVNPRMRQMLNDLTNDLQANGQIPYEALRRIRTSVGEQMSDFSMTPDTPAVQLRRLYGALSRDMEAVAQNAGPDAVRAARRANGYTRMSADRLEQVQRVVDKNGGPEAIYNAVMQGAKDGGTTLRGVMQSLPRDGQRAVTGAVIRRMGMPTAGQAGLNREDQFSAATFLTNWGNISTEARRALFDRHGPQFSRDMDRIARVADNIKTGAKVYANPSGTTNRAAAYTYGTALVASLLDVTGASTAKLIGGGLAANGLARTLTSPRAVRWLARATPLPRGAFPALIQTMRTEGRASNDPALQELADEFERRVNESPGAGQDN